MRIIEKFVSLQGEGRYQGYPTAFIRLHGCGLRCRWCDTQYSYHEEGQVERIEDIVKWIREQSISNICITGGEPLIQIGAVWTLLDLLDDGFNVSIETNGAIKIEDYEQEKFECNVQFVLDWKMPSSGMFHGAYDQTVKNMENLYEDDEVKFVIADANDYATAKSLLHHIPDGIGILFSPLQKWKDSDGNYHDGLEPKQLADWMVEDKLSNVRMNLQLHKIIWPEVERGV